MGLEAICLCRVDGVTAEAKALLEARDLTLRAPFRRTVGIAEMSCVEAAGGQLRFTVGSSDFTLELGPDAAAKWARRIATPAPSLAEKLGVGHRSPVFTIGRIDDPSLAEALDGHAADRETAKMSVAIVHDDEELVQALARHEAAMGDAPIWIVHGKGAATTFGETPVRERMRARGYRDYKVTAVSAALTATRYSSRR